MSHTVGKMRLPSEARLVASLLGASPSFFFCGPALTTFGPFGCAADGLRVGAYGRLGQRAFYDFGGHRLASQSRRPPRRTALRTVVWLRSRAAELALKWPKISSEIR